MGKGNDNDRYVVPSEEGGWDVVKENHQRASAHLPTKREAINRARQSSPTPAAERFASRTSKDS